jgi:hypothetical protein
LRNTIFSRQNTLLTAMERDLPRTCEELQLKLRDAHEISQGARANGAAQFAAVIETRTAAFANAASSLLHDCVYVPTQESLFFVLGETELAGISLPDREQTRRELMAVAADVAAVVHEDDSNLQRSLLDGEKDAAFKLAEHRKHWEKEWSELKGQFGLLADSASEVGVRLRESINELNRLLEEYARDGLQDVKRQIRETASQIRNGVRQRAGKVHTAVESARSKARSQLWLGVTAWRRQLRCPR